MISPSDPAPKPSAVAQTLGHSCADVLIRRNLVAEEDKEMIAEVINRFSGVAESVTSELSRRCLIREQNESAVTEFTKREVRRYLLKLNDLSGADLGRILGVNRLTASRIMKGTSNLTTEQIKKLAG